MKILGNTSTSTSPADLHTHTHTHTHVLSPITHTLSPYLPFFIYTPAHKYTNAPIPHTHQSGLCLSFLLIYTLPYPRQRSLTHHTHTLSPYLPFFIYTPSNTYTNIPIPHTHQSGPYLSFLLIYTRPYHANVLSPFSPTHSAHTFPPTPTPTLPPSHTTTPLIHTSPGTPPIITTTDTQPLRMTKGEENVFPLSFQSVYLEEYLGGAKGVVTDRKDNNSGGGKWKWGRDVVVM